MRWILFQFILLPVFLSAQHASITTQKFPGYSDKLNDSLIIDYPIIITDSKIAQNKINETIKLSIFGIMENDTRPMDSIVKEAIFDWLTGIDYEIYFNSNNILSVLISSEGYGAYPSTLKSYFNFNLKTGEALKITDIVSQNKKDDFNKQVTKDKFRALTKNKKEMGDMLNKGEIDKETYQWAEQYMSYCFESLDLENFIITKDYIQVFDECEFPRAIRNLSPVYELKYALKNWGNRSLNSKPKTSKPKKTPAVASAYDKSTADKKAMGGLSI